MLYYVEDVPGAWADPANIKSVIIDEKPGVPFEAHFYDLNNDGKNQRLHSFQCILRLVTFAQFFGFDTAGVLEVNSQISWKS